LPFVHWVPAPQTMPHAPQFASSFFKSTHAAPHDESPAAQADVH